MLCNLHWTHARVTCRFQCQLSSEKKYGQPRNIYPHKPTWLGYVEQVLPNPIAPQAIVEHRGATHRMGISCTIAARVWGAANGWQPLVYQWFHTKVAGNKNSVQLILGHFWVFPYGIPTKGSRFRSLIDFAAQYG